MIKTRKRLTACVVLIVLNIAFIWGNSLMSQEMSSAFSQLVGRIISLFFPDSQVHGGGENHGLLRKLAHFTEFCSLGFLLSWLVAMLRQKKWEQLVLPLLCGATVAAIDESLQMLIPGRGPAIRDVGIDTLGVTVGILLLTFLFWIKHRKHLK